MEKTVDLKMPGIVELGREELKETDGGTPFFAVIGVVASIIAVGAAIDYAAEKVIEGWENPK